MSKKLVAILTIVMFLAFTFAANAGEHRVGAVNKDISGNMEGCPGLSFVVGGLAEVCISLTGVGSIVAPIGGVIAGAAVSYACDEIADELARQADCTERVKLLCPVGSKVYWRFDDVDGVGTVTEIVSWQHHINIKSDGDGFTRSIEYGSCAYPNRYFKAFVTYK